MSTPHCTARQQRKPLRQKGAKGEGEREQFITLNTQGREGGRRRGRKGVTKVGGDHAPLQFVYTGYPEQLIFVVCNFEKLVVKIKPLPCG